MPTLDWTVAGENAAGHARPDVVHLINPLWDSNGGGDWRTYEMYRMLGRHCPVHIWSGFSPATDFAKRCPVRLIRPWLGRFPIGGTFIFVGAYFRMGHWFKASFPRRIILIYNTFQPDRLEKAIRRLGAWHRAPVELVYTSPLLRKLSSYPGRVIESPIDIARFVPRSAAPRDAARFRVGRLSRDITTKHHERDREVYSALAAAGVEVRIMGGTCLRDRVGGSAAPALLAAGAEPAVDFLQDLDCFYYRTSDQWLEAYGRVVFEAMACGLPVVCGRRGGYADYIVHGVNGFLFDSTEQAVSLILRLRDDPALRLRVGRAARLTVESMYRGSAWQQKQTFFLSFPEPQRA
ncbi:MAG TPA: glycosyltransferase family 4 protein [Casimicrobiaceae bacterium]|nr:glycosyltransferase family 4 protein [Casimicrobiaceae bacterium]